MEPEQTPTPKTTPKVTLNVLLEVKNSQTQHGLRHQDYIRYRQYCTRRLRRIRHNLKINNGRRFKPHLFKPEQMDTANHLLIPLVEAERCWSYSQDLKEESAENPRGLKHAVRRLSKSCKYADALAAVVNERGCEQTVAETEAYQHFIHGTHHVMRGEWKEGLERMQKATDCYSALAKTTNEDLKTLCEEKIKEINPSLRYCRYNLGEPLDGPTPTLATQSMSLDVMDMEADAAKKHHTSTKAKVVDTKHLRIRAKAQAILAQLNPERPQAEHSTKTTSAEPASISTKRLSDEAASSLLSNVAPLPPAFTAIPAKPLFFDLAYSHLEFPDIKEAQKPVSKKSKKAAPEPEPEVEIQNLEIKEDKPKETAPVEEKKGWFGSWW